MSETVFLYRRNINNAYDLEALDDLIDQGILVAVEARPVRYMGGLSGAIYPCRQGGEPDGYVVDASDVTG